MESPLHEVLQPDPAGGGVQL
jgi:hypothetical protein